MTALIEMPGLVVDGHLRPGYKQHTTVDNKRRVIVGISVTAANHYEGSTIVDAVDQAVEDMGGISPDAVCADGAYGSGKNRANLEKRGIRLISPSPKPINYTGKDYFTTEDFKYDEIKDEFICPAGCKLLFLTVDKERSGRRIYCSRRSQCKACPLKDTCTRSPRRQLKVGIQHAALIRLRADSKTSSFKKLYRSRAPVVEGVFGEA